MNQELLYRLLATDTIMFLTLFGASFLLFMSNAPKWLTSLCQYFCLMTASAGVVLCIIILWATGDEVFSEKLILTNVCFLLFSLIVLLIPEFFTVKKWVKKFGTGSTIMSLAAFPVLLVILIWV